MRIGITGGAGFIGSNLADQLVAIGHHVSILDNFDSGFEKNLVSKNIKIMNGDVSIKRDVENFFDSENFQFCFHLAAMGSVPRSILETEKSFNSNTVATFNIAEAIRERKITTVFSSSSSVYGFNQKQPKSESDWIAPISPYAGFKAAAESILQGYANVFNLDIKIFRLFNVYGPKQNPNSQYSAVIPKWIMAAIEKKPLIVFGNGEQRRDFTYVADVLKVFIKSIDQTPNNNLPVNLAFGNSLTLNSVLQIFKEYFGNIEIIYSPVRQGDIKDSESDPRELKSIYPEIKETQIRNGLFETFDWYIRNYKKAK